MHPFGGIARQAGDQLDLISQSFPHDGPCGRFLDLATQRSVHFR